LFARFCLAASRTTSPRPLRSTTAQS
jgi:hypothetical protein